MPCQAQVLALNVTLRSKKIVKIITGGQGGPTHDREVIYILPTLTVVAAGFTTFTMSITSDNSP